MIDNPQEIGGPTEIKYDGVILTLSDTSPTIQPNRKSNDLAIGVGGDGGVVSKYIVPYIKGEAFVKNFDPPDFDSATDITVASKCANGKTAIFKHAVFVHQEGEEYDPSTGKYPFMFKCLPKNFDWK